MSFRYDVQETTPVSGEHIHQLAGATYNGLNIEAAAEEGGFSITINRVAGGWVGKPDAEQLAAFFTRLANAANIRDC